MDVQGAKTKRWGMPTAVATLILAGCMVAGMAGYMKWKESNSRYPTEFEAPMIPTPFSSKDWPMPVISTFPVTPSTPMARRDWTVAWGSSRFGVIELGVPVAGKWHWCGTLITWGTWSYWSKIPMRTLAAMAAMGSAGLVIFAVAYGQWRRRRGRAGGEDGPARNVAAKPESGWVE